jgi:hypothetical protein
MLISKPIQNRINPIAAICVHRPLQDTHKRLSFFINFSACHSEQSEEPPHLPLLLLLLLPLPLPVLRPKLKKTTVILSEVAHSIL